MIDWKKAFELTRTCTKSTKLVIFHIKFLHRRLPTNSFLYQIAVKNNCIFCKEDTETLLHFFWQCKVTSHFWGTIFQWLQSCCLIHKLNYLAVTTAFGLKLDSINTRQQIICRCASREIKFPTFHNFCPSWKKTYEIKTKSDKTQTV